MPIKPLSAWRDVRGQGERVRMRVSTWLARPPLSAGCGRVQWQPLRQRLCLPQPHRWLLLRVSARLDRKKVWHQYVFMLSYLCVRVDVCVCVTDKECESPWACTCMSKNKNACALKCRSLSSFTVFMGSFVYGKEIRALMELRSGRHVSIVAMPVKWGIVFSNHWQYLYLF